MIQHSGDRFAQAVANRLGPLYQLFLFSGTPPTSIEEVPWSPVDIVSSEYPDQKGIDYNWIYTNMVSYVYCSATCNDSVRYDNVVFTHEVNDAGKPKMSYYDIREKKYRHIPQTLDTDLSKYDYFSGNNSANNNKPHAGLFWPDGTGDLSRFQVPSEDRTNGFYIEGDFGYEATINEIRWTGNTNNNFEGDLLIYRWDPALNAGAGDWVLFHTHTMNDSNLVQDIVLPGDYVTSKYRFELTEANVSATNSIIELIEFFGTEPDTNPVTQDPITWGVLAPVRPNRNDFYDFSMESPYMIVTAGGPADNVEMKMSQQVGTPGRVNSLLAGQFQFATKEY